MFSQASVIPTEEHGRHLLPRWGAREEDRGDLGSQASTAEQIAEVLSDHWERQWWTWVHPKGSQVPTLASYGRLRACDGTEEVAFAHCAWGGGSNKYSLLSGNAPWVIVMGRGCGHPHPHEGRKTRGVRGAADPQGKFMTFCHGCSATYGCAMKQPRVAFR